MEYNFTEIFDIPTLTRICKSFTQFSGMVTALLDMEGNVHIATGWQDICTRFHRVHSATACRCTESDTALAGQLEAGKSYNVYRCKNGLVDVAIPVIVDGEHVANFFTGQFFFEIPSIHFFRGQAQQFDFEEQDYLEALGRVPVFSEDQVKKTMDFLVDLTQLIGEMGMEKLRILHSEKLLRQELEGLVTQRTHELNKAKEALELANRELFSQSRTDELTNIFNRRGFDEFLESEWKRLTRTGEPLSLILMDVDHFKLLNDHYGHTYGDSCLENIAGELRDVLHRPTDIVARYGGEEFVCVLSGTPLEGAMQVAQSIRESIKALALPHEVSPVDPLVTLSIGVACCLPRDCPDPKKLISTADTCLYQAKNTGRNCILSQEYQRTAH